MSQLSQADFDEIRRLQDEVALAKSKFELAVMRKFAENRVDPRAHKLVINPTGASFVKIEAATNGAKSTPAPKATATAPSTEAPKRPRGRPRKTEQAPVAAAPAPALPAPAPAAPATTAAVVE